MQFEEFDMTPEPGDAIFDFRIELHGKEYRKAYGMPKEQLARLKASDSMLVNYLGHKILMELTEMVEKDENGTQEA